MKRTHTLHVDYRASDIHHCNLCHRDIDFGKVADCRPIQDGCVFVERARSFPVKKNWYGLLLDRLREYFK